MVYFVPGPGVMSQEHLSAGDSVPSYCGKFTWAEEDGSKEGAIKISLYIHRMGAGVPWNSIRRCRMQLRPL